jgi:hypothetical protein
MRGGYIRDVYGKKPLFAAAVKQLAEMNGINGGINSN